MPRKVVTQVAVEGLRLHVRYVGAVVHAIDGGLWLCETGTVGDGWWPVAVWKQVNLEMDGDLWLYKTGIFGAGWWPVVETGIFGDGWWPVVQTGISGDGWWLWFKQVYLEMDGVLWLNETGNWDGE